MKLIYQLFGIVLGFIIGLLTAATSVSIFALWAFSDTKKKSSVTHYSKTGKFSKPKAEDTQDPFKFKYESRREAEDVLDMLIALLIENGATTVQDLKIGLGISPTFADTKKGWRSLASATITANEREPYRVKTYSINFPDPIDV